MPVYLGSSLGSPRASPASPVACIEPLHDVLRESSAEELLDTDHDRQSVTMRTQIPEEDDGREEFDQVRSPLTGHKKD
ncbi:hypothetical protein NDU88_001334 [Pleurodeles waltl]|uniref:Uncharacterized protein n=1 Tax=Pleurodeles waltl TaxID=8319 RepID=A0AAV7NJR9_PLEWA|nr:hypothetical protein NDU88_001334 [Pleurodeles waltl]